MHSTRMLQDDRTAQEKLTPEERRTLLRAFADRMLLKVSAMDDPEDMPGVEKAVRVAAVIERIYYRCDRAEAHTPDPRKLEAERATHQSAAIRARANLANPLEWGEKRQKQLGKWWDAAEAATTQTAPQTPPQAPPQAAAETPARTLPTKTTAAPGPFAPVLKSRADLKSSTASVRHTPYAPSPLYQKSG